MRATIIHNPRAGRFNVAHMLPAVCTALVKKGWWVQSCEADEESGSDLTALARMACDDGSDTIFVAGGDGSVGAVASVLRGSDVTLGVLPCGTGNVWAQGLGLTAPVHQFSRALIQAAVRQATGSVRNVDIGSCNGRVFVLWAGIGLDGYIVHGIEPRRRLSRYFGRWHYIVRGILLARSWRGASVRLRGGDGHGECEILGVLATNVPVYAGGLTTLEPGARSQNGGLALWMFRGVNFRDALVQFARLLGGSHRANQSVERIVGRHFILESSRELPLQLDGEPAGAAEYYEIRVMPRALRVLVPQRVGRSGWNHFWS